MSAILPKEKKKGHIYEIYTIILNTHLALVGKCQRVVRIVSFRVHTRRHNQTLLALTFEKVQTTVPGG